MVDIFPLKRPGEVMGDKDSVEAGGEGRVDIGFGAVADHPRRAGLAAVMSREAAVGGVVLFREHLDSVEVRGKTGAAQLVGLLGVVSLGDEDEAVAGGKVGQGLLHMGQKFNLLIGDGLREAEDAGVLVGSNGLVGELLEAGDKRLAEAVQTVATGGNGGVLNVIEAFANLFGVVEAMVEVGDEGGDSALEVDVILPERVVGVDEQRLIGRVADGLGAASHLADYKAGGLGWREDRREMTQEGGNCILTSYNNGVRSISMKRSITLFGTLSAILFAGVLPSRFAVAQVAAPNAAQVKEAGTAGTEQNEVFHNTLANYQNRTAAVIHRYNFDLFNPRDTIARYNVYEFNQPGFTWGQDGGWAVQHGISEKGTFNTRGIGQMKVSNSIKHATGDFAAQYTYAWTDGGATAKSDEGFTLDTRSGGESDSWFHGSAAAGASPGTTLLPVTYAAGLHSQDATTDGAYMLDISKGTISGIVPGPESLVEGTSVHVMPVSVSLPPSTGIGMVATSIPAPRVKVEPEEITLSGVRLIKGSFTAGKACLAGGWYPEQVLITKAGPSRNGLQDVTIIHKNPNGTDANNPTSLWQGGVCGQYLSLDRNLQRDGFRTSYEVVGAIDSTHLAYIWNAMGTTKVNVLNVYRPPVALVNLSRIGGVVTASFAGANQSYIFDHAETVVIADASDPSFNGEVHRPEYVDDVNRVLKWPQAGRDAKASTATIDLPPSYYGFHLYPGAEVLGPRVAGGVPLEPNAVEWAAGDVIENPHHPSFSMNGKMTQLTQHTLSSGYNSNGQRWGFQGAGISANYQPSIWSNNNPCALYTGCGGTLEPIRWNSYLGPYRELFNIRNAPMNMGSLFTVGCDSRGCEHTPPYQLFRLQNGSMEYDPANGNFTVPRMTAAAFYGEVNGPVSTTRIELQDPKAPGLALAITNAGGKIVVSRSSGAIQGMEAAGALSGEEAHGTAAGVGMEAAAIGAGAGNRGGSAACAQGYTCTAERGRLTVIAPAAGAHGLIASVRTRLRAGVICTAAQNGGSSFVGIGSGSESENGFDITAGVMLHGTVTIDYSCR